MTVTVSAPKKVRKGFFSSIVYMIGTKIEQDGGRADSTSSVNKYSVARQYSDVTDLHKRLVADHRHNGVIVPPPPSRSRLATAVVAVRRGLF